MNDLFRSASTFDQPLDGWNVTQVTTMYRMFSYSTAFNQPLDGWSVDKVMSMQGMFYGARSFDQDLGWCIDYSVFLGGALTFYDTPCESTACGVVQVEGGCTPPPAPTEGKTDAASRSRGQAVFAIALVACLVF